MSHPTCGNTTPSGMFMMEYLGTVGARTRIDEHGAINRKIARTGGRGWAARQQNAIWPSQHQCGNQIQIQSPRCNSYTVTQGHMRRS